MTAWGQGFWQKMLDALGVKKSTIPGEGEFGYDKYGRVALDPRVMSKLGSGWDTSEVWNTGSPETGYKPRYAEGDVPPWMKNSLARFTDMKAAGALGQDDLNKLADHWVRGVGIDPVWAAAFSARPEWVSNYLRDFFRGLGATSV